LAAACTSTLAVAVLSRLDDSVRTPEDVGSSADLPVLGSIPSLPAARAALPGSTPSNDDNLPVVSSDPGTPFAEAYRSLRTTLLLSRAGSPPQVVVVTSPRPGEGKTVTTLNLAAVLAGTGSKVVVVDCDLRRPMVGTLAGIPDTAPGVSEVLAGIVSLENALCATRYERVAVLPSGAIPPNPAELLGGLALEAAIESLRAMFDFVIIDTPPVLAVTDGELVAKRSDGTVVVARSGSTPRAALRNATERLTGLAVPLLGVVLNDVDLRAPGYYREACSGYQKRRAA
jgi:capsular exopolysaccharide synthesis family protein